MSRRRMMMQAQEEEKVKEWVELLNGSKEATDEKTVEFDLANAEKHEEYWLYLTVDKHTGAELCKGNCSVLLNGANIGYFFLNIDWAVGQNANYHIYTAPIGVAEMAKTNNSIKFNAAAVQRQEKVEEETGTGKLQLNFPAKYTGKVTARVVGR